MQQDINSQEMPPLSLEAYRVLLPSIGGLALASAVVNVVVQQAHRTTGVSTFNGLSMLVSALAIGVLFLSTFLIKRFTKRFISAFTFASIHLAGFSCLALALLTASGIHVSLGLAVALQACVTVGSTFLKFYWLRKLRGTSAQAAVIVVFCALAISELATYFLSFSGELIWYTAGTLLSFTQFSAVRVSRKLGAAGDPFPAVSESYFGTDEDRFSNRSFLAVAALGICFISIPMGMGLGFPVGEAIYMSLVPRFMVLLFVMLVSAMWIRFGLASRMRAITTSIWVAMQVLLALGAIFFSIWPNTVSVGAAFIMGSSLVLQAFLWYLTIAFISFGWRDPFYYCSVAWIAMTVLLVAGMRVDAVASRVFLDNTPVIISIMSFFVLIGAQVVFTRLLASPSERTERQREAGAPITEDDVRRIPLMGVLAISPQHQAPMVQQKPDVHIATSVMEMGQRFGLTGREVEVLTLYALGHTQARVSEELKLSTNTVHTHIKRIYDKTDMHSRQEILDYIAEFGSPKR